MRQINVHTRDATSNTTVLALLIGIDIFPKYSISNDNFVSMGIVVRGIFSGSQPPPPSLSVLIAIVVVIILVIIIVGVVIVVVVFCLKSRKKKKLYSFHR